MEVWVGQYGREGEPFAVAHQTARDGHTLANMEASSWAALAAIGWSTSGADTVLASGSPSSDWTDPGVIVPLLAAVVSLLGVLFVNYSSGKRLIRMEERRSIAAASERKMSELRNERREAYAQLVAWQRRVEDNAQHFVPRQSESWEAWLRRAWPPKQADPSENHTLQELISKALVNGSPFETWQDAIKYANHVTATWVEAQHCVTKRDETYFTYLHNIWRSGSSHLPSNISGGIKEDLGITMGPLHILEEIACL